MTIQLDGTTVSTTMRTPGHDFELAVGFCHTEGLLAGVPVTGVRYCATGSAAETEFNVVTVETGGLAPAPTPRLGPTSSSCGWCGSDQLDDMCARLAPLPPTEPMPLELLAARAAAGAPSQQRLFGATGAVHAAAVFDRDGAIALRPRGRRPPQRGRQGGRRDAARRASSRPPVSGCSSAAGRASRWCRRRGRPGSARCVAVSAPTALAVDAARRAERVPRRLRARRPLQRLLPPSGSRQRRDR